MKTTTEYAIGTKINLNATDPISTTQMAYNGITRARMLIKLEARMALYDALHGTHYRAIRHQVARRDRDAAFEKSIGLIRTK